MSGGFAKSQLEPSVQLDVVVVFVDEANPQSPVTVVFWN